MSYHNNTGGGIGGGSGSTSSSTPGVPSTTSSAGIVPSFTGNVKTDAPESTYSNPLATITYSITNGRIEDEKKDLNTPFSFIDYLKYTGAAENGLAELSLYQNYLKAWESVTSTNLVSINADIRNQFIIFLEEVKLNFSNLEERRYLDNIDFNDNEQLSVALPFFITKIKDIALYYKKQRDNINASLQTLKRKGSLGGVERFVKDQLLNLYSGDDTDPNLTPPVDLTEFLKNLDVNVEPIYDTFNDYYDLDPSKPPAFYDTLSGNRFDYFTTNTNVISSSYYLDTKKAINDILNNNGIGLSEGLGVNVTFNTTDLSFAENINFQTYKNTGLSGNLSFLKQRDIPVNNMGTDMYYISSNENFDYTFNKLFDAKRPYRNLLNVNHPATIQIPGYSFTTGREIGLFYKPTNYGQLKLDTKFQFIIIDSKIKRNKVYVFPDPYRYGNVDGVGASRRENPIVFTPINNRIKNISSSLGQSLPKSRNIDQNFYSYTTREQFNIRINNNETLRNIPSINLSGSIVKETGDIFGNQFYIFNPTNFYNKNLSGFQTKTAALPKYNTSVKTLPASNQKETLTYINNKLKPIEVFNIKRNNIQPINLAFEKVFNRYLYDSDLYNQFNSNKFADLNIFGNTYFFKTSSYFVIDSINYETKKKEFEPAGFISRVRTFNTEINSNQDVVPISNFSNPYEVGKDIFYIKVESQPTEKPVNLTTFGFEIYKYNKEKSLEVNLITSQTQAESFYNNNFTFDTGSKILQISNIELSYNSKQNKFLCISNFRDLNNVCFIHVLIFKIVGNRLNIIENYVIGPNNFNTTQNFYETGLMSSFLTLSTYSQNIQENNYGTFRF